uniref:Cytochrome c oxidase subunit 2 n=1 Tax=Rhabdopleura compacta TaxID=638968 RepID=F8J473_RHACM|nr:cytochrome oxidase subunit II [Rhabdopleura compacta]
MFWGLFWGLGIFLLVFLCLVFTGGVFGFSDDLGFTLLGCYHVNRLHILHSHLTGVMVMVVLVVSFWICSGLFSNRRLGSFKDSGKVEVIMTSVPVFVLVTMIAPSMVHLYTSTEGSSSFLNFNVMGRMWYWQYFYPELGSESLSYDSYIVKDSVRPGFKVDYPLFLPINFRSKLSISSGDVIHSFSVPALGIKVDAVPGRINGFDVIPSFAGKYFGFCSELCGSGHSQMPCVISACSLEDYFSFNFTQSLWKGNLKV